MEETSQPAVGAQKRIPILIRSENLSCFLREAENPISRESRYYRNMKTVFSWEYGHLDHEAGIQPASSDEEVEQGFRKDGARMAHRCMLLLCSKPFEKDLEVLQAYLQSLLGPWLECLLEQRRGTGASVVEAQLPIDSNGYENYRAWMLAFELKWRVYIILILDINHPQLWVHFEDAQFYKMPMALTAKSLHRVAGYARTSLARFAIVDLAMPKNKLISALAELIPKRLKRDQGKKMSIVKIGSCWKDIAKDCELIRARPEKPHEYKPFYKKWDLPDNDSRKNLKTRVKNLIKLVEPEAVDFPPVGTSAQLRG